MADVDKDNVKIQALKKIETLSKEQQKMIKVRDTNIKDISNWVHRYLSLHWDNVHKVGRERFQPLFAAYTALLPFPVLFTGIGIDLDP
jgi:hypothetical protein